MIDRRLRVLRVLAERGTVSAAAADLGYTPSAVSQQLRGLARDLGVVLLEQEGRRVRLTPAAETLLARGDELLAHWEQIRAEVQRDAGGGASHLRLAGFSTAAAALLPAVATRVGVTFPRCRVRIIEADPQVCFDLLLADQADVAVVVATATLPPGDDPRFEQRRLLEDPLDLLMPHDHRLAGRTSVGLAEVADEQWILDRPGRPHHQLVITACSAAGFTPTVAHEAAEWDTGAALVAAGFGVSLVPRLARIPGGDELVRVPLAGDPRPARHILTSIRRGTGAQPEIAAALAELVLVATDRRDSPALER